MASEQDLQASLDSQVNAIPAFSGDLQNASAAADEAASGVENAVQQLLSSSGIAGQSTSVAGASSSGATGGQSGTLDNNSLIAALGGDATKIGATIIGANAGAKAAKSLSPTSLLILAGGGILILALLLRR